MKKDYNKQFSYYEWLTKYHGVEEVYLLQSRHPRECPREGTAHAAIIEVENLQAVQVGELARKEATRPTPRHRECFDTTCRVTGDAGPATAVRGAREVGNNRR